MNNAAKSTKRTAAQTRAIEFAERCATDFDKAMVARDAIESCVSKEWRLAHLAATNAARSKNLAYELCYSIGALPKPYWA